jgi:hypothetical protein
MLLRAVVWREPESLFNRGQRFLGSACPDQKTREAGMEFGAGRC